MSINNNVEPIGIWIWSRGGGGHEAVKKALVQQAKKNPAYVSKEYDLMGDEILNSISLPIFGQVGDGCVKKWDEAQKRGDVKQLTELADRQWLSEFMFSKTVYDKILDILRKQPHEPTEFVSTQALCLPAIARAIKQINKERGWNLSFKLYFTDMLTSECKHFTQSLSQITDDPSLARLLHLYVPSAQKEKDMQMISTFGETIQCTLLDPQNFPVREAFLEDYKLASLLLENKMSIEIVINSPSEKAQIEGGLSVLTPVKIKNNKAIYTVSQEDRVAFLMLGSKPTHKSVIQWIDVIVKESVTYTSQIHSSNHTYFFVYCGAPEMSATGQIVPNELLRSASRHLEALKRKGKLPANISIILFTNQTDSTLAPLIARADLTITRSGGSTCMELLHLLKSDVIPQRANRLSLIHSEGGKGGIPLWEYGNAQYLGDTIGAQIVTPKSAKALIRSHFFNTFDPQSQHSTLMNLVSQRELLRKENLIKKQKLIEAQLNSLKLQINSRLTETELLLIDLDDVQQKIGNAEASQRALENQHQHFKELFQKYQNLSLAQQNLSLYSLSKRLIWADTEYSKTNLAVRNALNKTHNEPITLQDMENKLSDDLQAIEQLSIFIKEQQAIHVDLLLALQLEDMNAEPLVLEKQKLEKELQIIESELERMRNPFIELLSSDIDSSLESLSAPKIEETIVEQPIQALSPQAQMYEDIANLASPEIAEVLQLILKKYSNEEIIKSWNVEADGRFMATFTTSLSLWINHPLLSNAGGVISVGVGTGETLSGRIIKDQGGNRGAKMSFEPLGGYTGLQLYFKKSLLWPKVQLKSIELQGDNVKFTAKYGASIHLTMGMQDIRELSSEMKAIPPSIPYDKYQELRVKGSSHDEAIARLSK